MTRVIVEVWRPLYQLNDPGMTAMLVVYCSFLLLHMTRAHSVIPSGTMFSVAV